MTIAIDPHRGYSGRAPAKSGADLGGSGSKRRISAPSSVRRFFCCQPMYYGGGCSLDTFGYAGFLLPLSANECPVVAHPFLAERCDDSSAKGVSPMAIRLFPARNPSRERASAHRAMAKAALFSDSSAAVRLRRYNSHIQKARAFEAQLQEVAQ